MKDIISEDAILAVKRGIYWLDENHPGWETRINLDNLDMADCRTCVIGQAVGDYVNVINSIEENRVVGPRLQPAAAPQARVPASGVIWAVEHGFEWPGVAAYYVMDTCYAEYDYRDLDALWSDEVTKRLR